MAYTANKLAFTANKLAYISNKLAYIANKLAYIANKLALIANKLAYTANKLTYIANKLAYIPNKGPRQVSIICSPIILYGQKFRFNTLGWLLSYSWLQNAQVYPYPTIISWCKKSLPS